MLELILSIFASIISLVALYFAHLRGPNITLICPKMQGKYSFSRNYSPPPFADLNFPVIFSNTGGRVGILMSVETESEQQPNVRITSKALNSNENFEPVKLWEGWTPVSIKSGDTYYAIISILISPMEKGLDETLKYLNPIKLKVKYQVTSWKGVDTKVGSLLIDPSRLVEDISS